MKGKSHMLGITSQKGLSRKLAGSSSIAAAPPQKCASQELWTKSTTAPQKHSHVHLVVALKEEELGVCAYLCPDPLAFPAGFTAGFMKPLACLRCIASLRSLRTLRMKRPQMQFPETQNTPSKPKPHATPLCTELTRAYPAIRKMHFELFHFCLKALRRDFWRHPSTQKRLLQEHSGL
jgi:hypothetical protein